MKILLSIDEHEASLSGGQYDIHQPIDYSSKELGTVAQLYYGTEWSDEYEALAQMIEKKYLTSSTLKHHASSLSRIYRGLGQHLFENYIPQKIGDVLRNLPEDTVILLTLNEVSSLVPWELLYIDNNFLCLRHVLGRITEREYQPGHPQRTPVPMLFIANPTGDLIGAQNEANYIMAQLRGSRISVSRYGAEIRKTHYLDLLKSGRFDLIHYSGHSQSGYEPGKSFHYFMDGPLYGYEIEALAGGNMPRLVFSNSCQSAGSIVQEDAGNTSLAANYLRAGVAASIAAIWAVSDRGSGAFASDFYRYLLFGSTIGEALLQARRNAFKRWGYSDFIWGSYIFYGNPSMKLF
ncbi:CHAT domain-containing protein [Candidatus Bathyarchaeota archaeon]|nr:MAG: CHAT domain-containing protein [Candidatus Bathyarchaeota archaeon]